MIPTCVDTDAVRARRRRSPRAARRTRDPVVGWIGSPTTASYIRGAGQRAAAGARAASVRAAGQRRRRAARDPRRARSRTGRGRSTGEVELFNTCDVGVYPLADDEWSKGKCGFKAIEFMACGVPVVAAAVGVNREIIQDGVNGFLASTEDEWVEKLARLLVRCRRCAAASRRPAGGPSRSAIRCASTRRRSRRRSARSPSGRVDRDQRRRHRRRTGDREELRADRRRRLRRAAASQGDPATPATAWSRRSIRTTRSACSIATAFDVRFFTEIERFDRHLEKLRRGAGGRARPLRQHLLAELSARRAHPPGAAGRRRRDLREAAGHQPLEPRRAAGARAGDRRPRQHRAAAAAAPAADRAARAARAQTRRGAARGAA